MSKALLALLFVAATVVGIAALGTTANSGKKVCPRGEHPVKCPYGIICCGPHDPVYCSCY